MLLVKHPELEIIVQPSQHRCYSDAEYKEIGVIVNEDLEDCDVLMGIKEVPKEELIENKIYVFFSHVIKKQSHNQKLLKEIIKKENYADRL